MEQDIKQIIQDAIYAPSGENCQPWSFRISGATINLFNLPERDQSPYNRGQYGSYVAHGAVLENIKISAEQLGYRVDIKLFPEPSNKNHIALISLEKLSTSIEKPILYGAIAKRVTNRKPYEDTLLSPLELDELVKSISDNSVKILITQKNSDKKTLAEIGSLNESIMMSNEFLHDFFFSHVTWTKEMDEQKKIGFFVDTLELPLPAKKLFKIAKNWKIVKFLNKFGFSKEVGKQNAKTYTSSSGFGILSIKDTSPESFINAGMALERIWLTATNLGLNFQPVSGLLFLVYAVKLDGTAQFSKNQTDLIDKGYETIKKTFQVDSSENVVFMFRIGHGNIKPTARSSRFNVEDFIQVA
ncbi:MAG: nitroreductase family protein [Patescibacteria group bacterium]|nr:nitroreductase family protein [Patescibacteria group bacterium]